MSHYSSYVPADSDLQTNMFIILLLISPTLTEWVEISQHHVRKPTRAHNFRPIEKITEEYFEEPTRSNKIYLNQTLTERPWSKGNINKVPKIGNVQRVQLDDSPIKAPSVKPVLNSLNEGSVKTVHKNVIKESVSASNDLMDTKQHKIDGNVENERYRTRIKFSSANVEKVNHKEVSNTKAIFNLENKDKRTETSVNTNQYNTIGSSSPNIDVLNDHNLATKQKPNVTLKPPVFGFGASQNNRHTLFRTEIEKSNSRRKEFGELPPTATDKNPVQKITSSEKVLPQRNKHTENVNFNVRDESLHKENKVDSKGSIIGSKLANHEFVTKVDKPINDDTDTTVSNEEPNTASSSESENLNSDHQNSDKEEAEESNNNKVNSIEKLMTFMKAVADTIRKNTQKSVNSKTRYLTNLKNTILANIAERIDAAWPDDEPNRRKSRAAHTSRGHHLEIPSSESALMTISFLTFAVFLIKLVLQVIQKYKNKAMMMSPAVIAVGRAAVKGTSKP